MSPALLHRPAGSRRTAARLLRDFADARRRCATDKLRQRAAWVEQARHTPTLEDWIDDDLIDPPARGAARIARLLSRLLSRRR